MKHPERKINPYLVSYGNVEKSKPKESHIWVGSDLLVENTGLGFQLEPGLNSVPTNLDQLSPNIPAEYYKYLQISGRSRITQRGNEVLKCTGERMADYLQHYNNPHYKQMAKMPIGKFFAEIYNYSGFSYYLPHETGIGRLYAVHGQPLKGKDLVDRIRQRDIRIEGKEGKEWWFNYNNQDEAIGVDLLLNLQKAKFLPRGKGFALIDGKKRRNYREHVDDITVPMPKDGRTGVTICETDCDVIVPCKVYGVMDTSVVRRSDYGRVILHSSYHLNSVLIQPGTHWRIRSEIHGPTGNHEIANAVSTQFVQEA